MNKDTKTLLLVRGVPGSGKSSLAAMFADDDSEVVHFEADQYFYDENGIYNFDTKKLWLAHKQCISNTSRAMLNGIPIVIVSNTSTTEKEIKTYKDLADEHGYRFISIVVENRHGNSSVHGVPAEKMEEMKNRFSLRL